jgi:nitrogen fixation/metabolism regulation signal transduction histidine kinase
MKLWKNLELEWKILIIACLLFIAFVWPIQSKFAEYLDATLKQSVDQNLEHLLRQGLQNASEDAKQEWIESLERHKQWQAMLPIIVQEQKNAIIGFSVLIFIVLAGLALWTLKRLTRPLKDLALAADFIGKGEKTDIQHTSGGALGRLQYAMWSMQYELQNLREKLVSEGMEKAWRDIARVMAHEIKNPLTPIRLTLDRLEEKIQSGQQMSANELMKLESRIVSQIEQLERLVSAFSSFAREPEVNLRKIALKPVLSGVAESMKHSIKTTINGDGVIQGDPYLLNQIALNIWKNSAEAGANEIFVQVTQNQKSVNVVIIDNGPGLDKEKLDKVFVPYITFKPGGTGLGLPVVKRLVESMKGSIGINSGKQKGLVIEIRFPLSSGD